MLENIGAIAFGLVIGWVTYRTLRRNTEAVSLSDIATVFDQYLAPPQERRYSRAV